MADIAVPEWVLVMLGTVLLAAMGIMAGWGAVQHANTEARIQRLEVTTFELAHSVRNLEREVRARSLAPRRSYRNP